MHLADVHAVSCIGDTNKLQHCHITFLWQICLQKYSKGMNKLMQKEDLVDNGK